MKRMRGRAIKSLYQRARELRNNSTHAEQILCGSLTNKPFGFKFRRQHSYSIYTLDFYCHALLVIEVDGSIHQQQEIKSNDRTRQASLENAGMKVLRFSNDEVLMESETVIKSIENYVNGIC